MNFIDYCIANKNYSAINTIRDYTRLFTLSIEDNRDRRKMVAGSLAALTGAYLLGSHNGKSDRSDEEKLAFLEWHKRHPNGSVDDYAKDHWELSPEDDNDEDDSDD